MSFPLKSPPKLSERLQDLSETDTARLVLSTLIILSVTPQLDSYAPVFFLIFAAEFILRLLVLREKIHGGELNRAEVVLLAFDLFAIVSFLPLEFLFKARFLRLVRLSRMLMLLGYWRPVVREIWIILTKRERRYQLMFVASSVVILTLSAAILLYHLRSFGIDFNENGTLSDDQRPAFWTIAWWSFRQLQDPGNLLREPSVSLVFLVSFMLTMCGIFIIAFLIGIGTSVVEELVAVGRERRLGIRGHSLIANLGAHSGLLVQELVTYYAKSLRSPRLVTMGPARTRYDFMHHDRLRRVRYRQGSPSVAHDLVKVDADRSRRVILLGRADHAGSDAEIVSQILSVRECNPHCLIFAELFDSDNLQAALAAGGNTVPILTHHFLALIQAQILTSPGCERVYGELLSTDGQEIYTCVFASGAMANHRAPASPPPFDALLAHCLRHHGVLLLGLLEAAPETTLGFVPRLNPAAATADERLPPDGFAAVAGYFGVTANFEQLRKCMQEIPSELDHVPAADPTEVHFELAPLHKGLKKILICGLNDGLLELCDQLTTFCPGITIFLLLPSDQQRDRLADAFLCEADRPPDGSPRPAFALQSNYERLGVKRLRYTVASKPERGGEIHLMVGNWAEERTITTRPDDRDYALAQMEAIFYTYVAEDDDPDARTALGLFKLMRLAANRPNALHPRLRVMCAIRNGAKADLFARRFASHDDPVIYPRVTVIPVERLRNSFIAQTVFVPGIAQIYDEMLSSHSRTLCRLEVTTRADPPIELDFPQLVAELYRRQQVIPVAVELDHAGSTRVFVTPARNTDGYHFSTSVLRAVYAIGSGE